MAPEVARFFVDFRWKVTSDARNCKFLEIQDQRESGITPSGSTCIPGSPGLFSGATMETAAELARGGVGTTDAATEPLTGQPCILPWNRRAVGQPAEQDDMLECRRLIRLDMRSHPSLRDFGTYSTDPDLGGRVTREFQ